jgi:hypothetical protein
MAGKSLRNGGFSMGKNGGFFFHGKIMGNSVGNPNNLSLKSTLPLGHGHLSVPATPFIYGHLLGLQLHGNPCGKELRSVPTKLRMYKTK